MCEVREFFPKDEFQPGQTMVVSGRQKSGKSTFVYDICNKLEDQVDMFIAIDDAIDMDYSSNTCVYSSWNEDCMDRFLRTQQETWRQYLRRKPTLNNENGWEPKKGLNICLIIRINTIPRKVLDSNTYRKMIANNRCKYNLRIVLVCHNGMDLPPFIRSNATWVFCTKANNEKHLHQVYFTEFEKLKHFTQLFQKITPNYTLLGKNKQCTYWWYKVDVNAKQNKEAEFQIIKKFR